MDTVTKIFNDIKSIPNGRENVGYVMQIKNAVRFWQHKLKYGANNRIFEERKKYKSITDNFEYDFTLAFYFRT